MDEIFYYDGEFTGEEIDEAVGAALYPDSTPDATHTSNLITSAAVAGVQGSIASISITGTTNNTGSTIAAGTYFYLNGALAVAKTSIADGAPFTDGTNYEIVAVGGLNALQSVISTIPKFIRKSTNGSTSYTIDVGDCWCVYIFKLSVSAYVTATVSNGTETVTVSSNDQPVFLRVQARSSTLNVVVTDQYSGNPMALMFMCC